MLEPCRNDSQLGEYLRARREQLQPADVGLPTSGRRRTPGLRREEVATLAGVSIDYLVRLEQGRDVNPSAGVLAGLAAALRLDDDERMHLFKLAAISGSSELCPAARAVAVDIPPSIRQLLERLDPTPAFVLGAAGDVLAANRAWETIVRPLGMLDGDGAEPRPLPVPRRPRQGRLSGLATMSPTGRSRRCGRPVCEPVRASPSTR